MMMVLIERYGPNLVENEFHFRKGPKLINIGHVIKQIIFLHDFSTILSL